MRETVRLIGRAIRQGSYYLPTRNLAAAYASKADPKDYLGQAESIYKGFLENWRYVKDPLSRELLTMGPRASYKLVMGGDGVGVGFGKGAGDCDCATVALGSMYESTGFPVRIATIARKNAPRGQLMEHVYPEVYITGIGWIAADPVLHPYGDFGDEAPHSRKVVYDLNGQVLLSKGNLQGVNTMTIPEIWKRPPMATYQGLPNFDDYEDYSDYYDTDEPLISGFGSLAFDYGFIPGGKLNGLSVEVDADDYENGLVDTPALEVSPEDFEYMRYMGCPVMGCLGLSDDGDVYQFDGFSFKKVLKNLTSSAKKAAKKLKSTVDKAFRKEKKSSGTELTLTEAIDELVSAGYLPREFQYEPQKLSEASKKQYTNIAKKFVSASTPEGTRKNKLQIAKIDQEMKNKLSEVAAIAKKKKVADIKDPIMRSKVRAIQAVFDTMKRQKEDLVKFTEAAHRARERKFGKAATRRVKVEKKKVKPIIDEIKADIKALAPVAGIVPGMGPALKVGLQAAARAGDAVLAETATKTLKELSRISPEKVEQYTAAIAKKTDVANKLKDAVQKYRIGQKQLKTAKSTIAKLKKQMAGKVTASEEVDIRATDALRMAQNLLEQQLAAQKKATQVLKSRGKTKTKAVKRVSATRAKTTRATTSRSGVRRA